jgi:phosphatidate cytidylyltransferase
MNTFGKRLLTAGVVLPLVILSVHAGPTYLAVLLVIVAILGARELSRLARARGGACPVWMAALAVAAVIGTRAGWVPLSLPTVLVMILGLAFSVELFRAGGSILWGASQAMLVTVYLGVLPAQILRLYDLGNGGGPNPWAVDYALALVWTGDTTAYLVGSRFGRRKLMPRVSPKKSWEGAVAGLLACVAIALALGRWAPAGGPAVWIGAGVVVCVAGLLGDLCESLMKREATMKDSGTLLPGHGGVLDRIDSVIFAAPALYYWFRLFERGA